MAPGSKWNSQEPDFILRIKTATSCMLDKCFTTVPHPGHLFKLSIERQDLSGIAQANLKPGL